MKIVSIEELRKEMLGVNDLQEFVYKQQELLEKYINENKKLQEKLDHCEKLLKSNSHLLVNNTNDEEIICVQQIEILRKRSMEKELDINDVKKLDILIKNLNLIRSKPTDVIDVSSRDVSQEELLAIATGQNKTE